MFWFRGRLRRCILVVFHSCVFLALEPVSCSQSHQMQRTGSVATLLGTSPYVWTPSRRLGQGQASSIGSELEVCKTVGKTKKTKKTKISTKSKGWKVGPAGFGSNLFLFCFFLFFRRFCIFAFWADTCPSLSRVFFGFLGWLAQVQAAPWLGRCF